VSHLDDASRPGEEAARMILTLYVTGQTPRSERAIANLQRVCAEELDGRCEVAIVDVLERPDLAEQERILATPTLIRRFPPPTRRIIGDLSDARQVALGLSLGLHPGERPEGGVDR
jgi:circadian clock protein KaiB